MTSPVLWSSRWHVMSPVRGRTRELGTSGTSRRFQQDGLTLEGPVPAPASTLCKRVGRVIGGQRSATPSMQLCRFSPRCAP